MSLPQNETNFGIGTLVPSAMLMNRPRLHSRVGARIEHNSGTATAAWLRALAVTKPIPQQPMRVLPIVINELAEKSPDAPALLSEHECMDFKTLAERLNRYSRWALSNGVTTGDVVCLLMANCPEYVAVWLGITAVGGVVALLNTNLRGASLAHCVNLAGPKHIIVGGDMCDVLDTALSLVTSHVRVWRCGKAGSSGGEGKFVQDFSGGLLELGECHRPSLSHCALLIYTSGTTGLPKAARVSHQRLMTWSFWFAGMMDVTPSDRLYNCLPMYHSVGGVVSIGTALVRGGSAVVVEKFSARRFWDDVVQWDCTLFQYIGELCRYLVRAEPHPLERAHRIRLCCGNGLRSDVWNEFMDRFQIPSILEFYASTEGNVTLFNYEGKPGAIGRIPSFLSHRTLVALVKCDVGTGELIRQNGRCVRCAPEEAGEALGRIAHDRSETGVSFEGYSDHESSESKLVRDVFDMGDLWYRTGDLLRQDEIGFFYFVDRIGDTFRWKGENVSTVEVAEALMSFPGIVEATAYGVPVPGSDGRVGMAAIVTDERFKEGELLAHLRKRLPDYACPVFLRVMPALELTSTFKPKKAELVRGGFDPACPEPIYFLDKSRSALVRMDNDLHDQITSGELRL
jgi:fatty-acyl-CoA synthase